MYYLMLSALLKDVNLIVKQKSLEQSNNKHWFLFLLEK